MRRTWSAHAAQVDVETALVLDEGGIALLSRRNPVAYLLAQLQVVVLGAVELVGEGAEEAVAVADGVGGIETQSVELLVQLLGVLRGVIELRGYSACGSLEHAIRTTDDGL